MSHYRNGTIERLHEERELLWAKCIAEQERLKLPIRLDELPRC
jgi:hypothetical protein